VGADGAGGGLTVPALPPTAVGVRDITGAGAGATAATGWFLLMRILMPARSSSNSLTLRLEISSTSSLISSKFTLCSLRC